MTTINGSITEMTSAVYCMSNTINFNRIKGDDNIEYLSVSYDNDDNKGELIYFNMNEIPIEVKTIYDYTRTYSEIFYDKITASYELIGTHLLRKNEYDYVISRFSSNPIENSKVSFKYTELVNKNIIGHKIFKDKEFFVSLMDEMKSAKNIN